MNELERWEEVKNMHVKINDNMTFKLSYLLKEVLKGCVTDDKKHYQSEFLKSCNWVWRVYEELIKNGYIKGQLDELGYVYSFDKDEAREFLFKLIESFK